MLFVPDNEEGVLSTLPLLISDEALAAAENFVDVCCQHAAYLTGRKDIDVEIEKVLKGRTLSYKVCYIRM